MEGDYATASFQRYTIISIHSLRVEGDGRFCRGRPNPPNFNPLPPCGGRPNSSLDFFNSFDFNPLPPCGGRPSTPSCRRSKRIDFNPLPPCGGRPKRSGQKCAVCYFNPLPPCGGRLPKPEPEGAESTISIHSLRVEGDMMYIHPVEYQGISIHSLRVEGDQRPQNRTSNRQRFQSTPSVWRETAGKGRARKGRADFNPLPPCGGRRYLHIGAVTSMQFQSTPSVWRETASRMPWMTLSSYFNPLPPCGGRLDTVSKIADHIQFQSTPSVWRET